MNSEYVWAYLATCFGGSSPVSFANGLVSRLQSSFAGIRVANLSSSAGTSNEVAGMGVCRGRPIQPDLHNGLSLPWRIQADSDSTAPDSVWYAGASQARWRLSTTKWSTPFPAGSPVNKRSARSGTCIGSSAGSSNRSVKIFCLGPAGPLLAYAKLGFCATLMYYWQSFSKGRLAASMRPGHTLGDRRVHSCPNASSHKWSHSG